MLIYLNILKDLRNSHYLPVAAAEAMWRKKKEIISKDGIKTEIFEINKIKLY